LLFADNSQVALRAETVFEISQFHYQEAEPAKDNMVMQLLKGGLRAVSGFISKRGNRDAYLLKTPTASMGIRGTDYIARLCSGDCDLEQKQGKTQLPKTSISGTIGRIAELEGELYDKRKVETIKLEKAQAFFENDELLMGDKGYALLVFTDGSRILLQAGSRLLINHYHYEQANPDNGVMLLNMVQGVARIATGLIGKLHPENVQFNTATAKIGIRGTAFDIVCGLTQSSSCDKELFVAMRQGITTVQNETAGLEAVANQIAYVADNSASPQLIEQLPNSIKENPYPLPENIEVDVSKLFGTEVEEVLEGFYVSVNEGRVVILQGSEVEISKGESGYAPFSGLAPLHFNTAPAFMDSDPQLGRVSFSQGLCAP
jgi:hypothetical protein